MNPDFQALRREFPETPIVADLKTMDGGYLEAEMMAKAGATHVVVMARAHAETIKCVVKAGRDFGVKVMGDNMVFDDKAAASKWLEDLGVDYIVHHTGFDERNGIFADTGRMLSPLDDLDAARGSLPDLQHAVSERRVHQHLGAGHQNLGGVGDVEPAQQM